MDAKKSSQIINLLKKTYPKARVALEFRDPLELLVSTILSAQCTDERVNKVTKELFKKYKSAKDYANADIKIFESQIHSTGFYHNKAKNIINAARLIVEKFNGKVPDTMEALLTLPGVARKTANIVLFNAYGKIEGIAVDTHARRLSQRLGYSKSDNPQIIERDLMEVVPKTDWGIFTNLLISHGRAVCKAQKPMCPQCLLNKLCPSAKIFYLDL